MIKYSVFIAPALKVDVETSMNDSGIGRKVAKKTLPDSAKHWEFIGKIESKNKKLAMQWLKKNQPIDKGFMFVLLQPKIEG